MCRVGKGAKRRAHGLLSRVGTLRFAHPTDMDQTWQDRWPAFVFSI